LYVLNRLLPKSLASRVFALYSVTLLAFVGIGLALFFKLQFERQVEEAQVSSAILVEMVAQSVQDSVLIGDYDTVKKMLERSVTRSQFEAASFIDTKGGKLRATNADATHAYTPQWLHAWVDHQLYDINRLISVGGRDYGVLRFTFDSVTLAADLWSLWTVAVLVAIVSLMGGLLLVRFPLQRWLGNLDQLRAFEEEIRSGTIDAKRLLAADAPTEIRQIFEVLNRTAVSLQEQREQASVTLQSIADGVVTADRQGRVIYVNHAATQMLRKPVGELVGHPLVQALPELFSGTGQIRLERWTGRRCEVHFADGGALVLDTSLSPMLDTEGRLSGHVLTWRDVTESHALEKKLRVELQAREVALQSLRDVLKDLLRNDPALRNLADSEGDLQAMSRLLGDLVHEREASRRELDNQKFALDQHAIVSVTDRAGNIIYANDRFCEISEYSRDEMLGKNHRFINSQVHPPEFFSNMWQTISSGKVWHGEVCNRTKSGKLYWVSATVVPLLDEDGKIEQYIAIRTDISDRKRAEASMLAAKVAAEQANRAKSEFLANMSHEIRTPMNGIMGMTELALYTDLSEQQREYLSIVKGSAESLLTIINDILDFSKIEAGKLSLEKIAFNLPELIRETLKACDVRAREKGLTLEAEIDPRVPEVLTGDPGRLRQVLVNLIGNAVKFTEQGGVLAGVTIESQHDESLTLHLFVRDTGLGISIDKQKHIFEAFAQEDTSITRRFGGTGLGLTISSSLVNLMGGRIWLDSELGQGSTFHFTAVLGMTAQNSLQPLVNPAVTTQPSPEAPAQRTLQVLLVEDHLINQKLATSLIERWGHRVSIANNGQEAVDALLEQAFDLVFMDMQMPVMDGLEATRRIRSEEQSSGRQRVPIVAMTANAMQTDIDSCMEAGMDDFISKPFKPQDLQQRLTHYAAASTPAA